LAAAADIGHRDNDDDDDDDDDDEEEEDDDRAEEEEETVTVPTNHSPCSAVVTERRLCKRLMEFDRCLRAKEKGYQVWMTVMQPLSCTPKHHILVGIPGGPPHDDDDGDGDDDKSRTTRY